jgi:hypothetical protein
VTKPNGGRSAWLSDDAPAAPKFLTVRRTAGLVLAAAAVLVAIGTVLGAWNPWRLVVLLRYFGDPFAGATLVSALLLVSVWLLTPVTLEARQGTRLWARLILAALLLVAFGTWAVAGGRFGGSYEEIAHSSDGSRRLVVRVQGEQRELHIWSGTGVAARDRGRIGLACGEVVGSFTGNDRVRVSSVYGQFDLRLNPQTGAPESTMGPTCSG